MHRFLVACTLALAFLSYFVPEDSFAIEILSVWTELGRLFLLLTAAVLLTIFITVTSILYVVAVTIWFSLPLLVAALVISLILLFRDEILAWISLQRTCDFLSSELVKFSVDIQRFKHWLQPIVETKSE
ncbi:MAG: hypothetical protein BVN35_06215 [Proteobacteria bacterium ST_bin11]|nr:MAG: hypothetical protein BVN35_06215 [Proteobacteria bacterium ST_bin11]